MNPTKRNFLKLQIENDLYTTGESCYYEFYVPDADLNRTHYLYFWDIEIVEKENVDIYISNGAELATGNSTVTVSSSTGYRHQYVAERNRVYMSFTGNVAAGSTKDPAFAAQVTLRSFLIGGSSTGTTTDADTTPVVNPVSTSTTSATTLEEYLASTDESKGPLILT